jgi:hypothetical protein
MTTKAVLMILMLSVGSNYAVAILLPDRVEDRR